jgi:small subunit ribosomal protein S20
MPHTKGAKKNLKQSIKRNAANRKVKSQLRKELKEVRAAVAGGDAAAAGKEAIVAQKKLDLAAARGVIHPNKAARLKSRMSKLVKSAKTK